MAGQVRVVRPITRGRPSPFWAADFTLSTGERIRRSTGCEEQGAALQVALQWYREGEQAVAAGVQGTEQSAGLTVVELADDFIDARRRERAERYVSTMVDHLRAYILVFFGGGSQAAAITRRRVEEFRSALLAGDIESKAAHVRRTGLLAPATVNRIMVTLRRLLDFGLRRGNLCENAALNLPPLKERVLERHRALSDDEIDALIEALREGRADDDTVIWLRFMIATGLRNDEAQTLNWIDVDRDARKLLVRAENAKGARSRRVPLTNAALAALAEIHDGAPAVGLVFGRRDRRTALLCAWARTGRPGRAPTAHDLRHTCASRAAAAGLDLVQMMSWFGWMSPTVAQRYLHLYGDRWADMAAKMDGAGRKG